MSGQHTPGPWLREGRFIYALEDCEWQGKPAKRNRFECSVQSGNHAAPEAELEANARVMQTALDLLEACEAALAAVNYMGDILNGMDAVLVEDEEYAAPIFEQVKAAIAKARGDDDCGAKGVRK